MSTQSEATRFNIDLINKPSLLGNFIDTSVNGFTAFDRFFTSYSKDPSNPPPLPESLSSFVGTWLQQQGYQTSLEAVIDSAQSVFMSLQYWNGTYNTLTLPNESKPGELVITTSSDGDTTITFAGEAIKDFTYNVFNLTWSTSGGNATSGDIVFYQSKDTAGNVVRCFTGQLTNSNGSATWLGTTDTAGLSSTSSSESFWDELWNVIKNTGKSIYDAYDTYKQVKDAGDLLQVMINPQKFLKEKSESIENYMNLWESVKGKVKSLFNSAHTTEQEVNVKINTADETASSGDSSSDGGDGEGDADGDGGDDESIIDEVVDDAETVLEDAGKAAEDVLKSFGEDDGAVAACCC